MYSFLCLCIYADRRKFGSSNFDKRWLAENGVSICVFYFLYFCICKCSHFCICIFLPAAGNSAAGSLTNGGCPTMESVARLHCVTSTVEGNYPLEQQSIESKQKLQTTTAAMESVVGNNQLQEKFNEINKQWK